MPVYEQIAAYCLSTNEELSSAELKHRRRCSFKSTSAADALWCSPTVKNASCSWRSFACLKIKLRYAARFKDNDFFTASWTVYAASCHAFGPPPTFSWTVRSSISCQFNQTKKVWHRPFGLSSSFKSFNHAEQFEENWRCYSVPEANDFVAHNTCP